MTLTAIPTTSAPSPVFDPSSQEQARMEFIESLPVRLEAAALSAVMALHEQQRTPEAIGRLLHLDQLVVALEIRRELDRCRHDPHVAEAQSSVSRLTCLEWNRVARGGHIPNQPLRSIIDRELAKSPVLTLGCVLSRAGIADVTHADRLLGAKPYTGYVRPAQTISCEQATRLARAIGLTPAEVPGL